MSIAWGALLLASLSGGPHGAAPGTAATGASALTLDRVARFPPPGGKAASGYRFTHDGNHLYYLAPEGPDGVRVLVREEVATGKKEVVGRPAGGAAAGLSHEEVLRRERLRIQDTGITQFVLAERADRAVYALGGVLYLVRPGAVAERLDPPGAGALAPGLSPDGTRLAYVRGGDLHVLDLSTHLERRLTTSAKEGVTNGLAEYIAQEEMARSDGFWWSPDGRMLAFAEADETGIPEYPIVQQGRDPFEVETYRYPFAGGPNARVRLGVVPAAGGKVQWLELGRELQSGGYLARVTFGPDGAIYAQVQSRDQHRLRLVRYAPSTFTARDLHEDRDGAWTTPEDAFRVFEDGRFLWSSEESGSRHLVLHAADGKRLGDLTPGDFAVDAVAGVDEKHGRIYFTAARGMGLTRVAWRVGLDGNPPTRVGDDAGFHTITVSPAGTHLVDLHDALRTPPRADLLDADGKPLRVLDANDDPEVASLGLITPQVVTVPGADGAPLNGALFLPPGAAGKRSPAIVRVYGGPTVQTVKDSWEVTADLRAQYLAAQGYVVFRLDNRGTPRRGRPFEIVNHRRLGTVEVEDQVAGARWLAARDDVDGDRIGVYGWSYGGYMALLCVLRAPGIFKAAVAGAPVTDWDGYDTHYTERYMGTPADNPDGYRGASVLPIAGTLERPLLIVHGMADENVHFRHTARLLNALNGAARPYDLLTFPDERHLPRGQADRVLLERRLIEHFDRALGVTPASPRK
ncbi:MAG TPA: DPP IV N-terminal domain-containing protein [Candidatus Polarisedimenticolia bacterium]|nr:DPP IV N-terminal domain-containing protein [Candidatus Polarisedimenticolia bacterium]